MRFLRIHAAFAVAAVLALAAFAGTASADGVYFSSPANDNTYVNSTASIPTVSWAFIGEIVNGGCGFERVTPNAASLASNDCFDGTNFPTVNSSLAPAQLSFTWNVAPMVSGDGTYRVFGYAGFISLGAANFSRTFTLDTVDPTIELGGPSAWTDDSTPAVSFLVYDANLGTSYCAVDPADSADKSDYSPCASGDTLPAVSDGAHELWVMHEDLAGNVSTAHHSFQVDATAPQISVTGLSAGEVMTSAYPVASVTATDAGSGINFLSCAWDGATPGSCTNNAFTMALLADGQHVLNASAIDQVGNKSTIAMPFSVDTTGGLKQGLVAPKTAKWALKLGRLSGSSYASAVTITFALPAGGTAKFCLGSVTFSVMFKKHKVGSSKVKYKATGAKCTVTATPKLAKKYKGKKLGFTFAYKSGPIKAFTLYGSAKV
jgi:hypothetical protein